MEIKSSADFVRMTRATLAASGFARREAEGMVWWESEAPAASLVLVHGVNDHAGTWCTVAPALAQRFHVILPDLPGHGESAPATGPLPISHLVDRLEAILPTEPVILVGNSLGGWLSMLYTLRLPDRVQQLILESSGGLNRPIPSKVIAHDREEALEILRNVHGPAYVPPEWVIEALLARATDSPMLRVTEVAEHAIDDRLRDIAVPTHLIWGEHDGVLPLDYAQALQQGIPDAKLHVIEGAAHIPHMQQPERFIRCLTAIC